MALVPQSWAIDLTFTDRDNNTSTMTAYVADATAFADVETIASGLVAAAGALSDAPITAYSVGRRYRDDAAPIAPEIADVERKGYFSFRLADGRLTSFSVPAIKNTLVVDGTNVLNRADALIVAFVAAIQTGGTDRVGVSIDTLQKAEKRHRGSTKG